MGNWQLEVGRMMLYVSFPVGVFHYFNQRENIEEWVIEQRKKHCPPISKKQHEECMQLIKEINNIKQMKHLEEMEKQYEQINGKQVM